ALVPASRTRLVDVLRSRLLQQLDQLRVVTPSSHVNAEQTELAVTFAGFEDLTTTLELLDTSHGLAWDRPGPVPRVYGLEAPKLLHKRGIFRKECSLPTTMRAQAPGPMPKETMMRFYQQPHAFYCGVDLHARTMYLCVLDHAGAAVLHKEVPA